LEKSDDCRGIGSFHYMSPGELFPTLMILFLKDIHSLYMS
jgi:hypothetical protein